MSDDAPTATGRAGKPAKFNKYAWLKNTTHAPGITGAQWYALIEVFNRSDAAGGNAYLSAEALARVSGLSERAARKALVTLVDRGVIVRVAKGGRAGDGRQWASTYALGDLLSPNESGRRPVDPANGPTNLSGQPEQECRSTPEVNRNESAGRHAGRPEQECRSSGGSTGTFGYVNRHFEVPQPEPQFLPSDQLPTDQLSTDQLARGSTPGNAHARARESQDDVSALADLEHLFGGSTGAPADPPAALVVDAGVVDAPPAEEGTPHTFGRRTPHEPPRRTLYDAGNGVARVRLPGDYPDLLDPKGTALKLMPGMLEAEGRAFLDAYRLSGQPQDRRGLRTYLAAAPKDDDGRKIAPEPIGEPAPTTPGNEVPTGTVSADAPPNPDGSRNELPDPGALPHPAASGQCAPEDATAEQLSQIRAKMRTAILRGLKNGPRRLSKVQSAATGSCYRHQDLVPQPADLFRDVVHDLAQEALIVVTYDEPERPRPNGTKPARVAALTSAGRAVLQEVAA
ncbi:MarR family transcriptional regulator [Tsukamurella soli]|uniref:Helix-turn-helix domain-containing protein n=1 Tax=Tsukamurella soli TaxID=644556 RepID=A0ABP8J7K1_9ACTN